MTDTNKTIVKLTKPVQAHGETISELKIREPTGDDVIAAGYPFIFVVSANGGQGTEMQTKNIQKLISRCAAVPDSTVSALSVRDFNEAMTVILGFFGGLAGGETETSSPAS